MPPNGYSQLPNKGKGRAVGPRMWTPPRESSQMDFSQFSQMSNGDNGSAAASRRTWSMLEEQCLISALHALVARGFKCDNGFKPGYFGMLQQELEKAFPGTDLKANPHISSKLHVWKKQYAALVTILSRSGIGWNDSCNMIECTDDVWAEYVKTDKENKSVRAKPWPYYKDWLILFGKDRATGEHAKGHADHVKNNEPPSSSAPAIGAANGPHNKCQDNPCSPIGRDYIPYPVHELGDSFGINGIDSDFMEEQFERYAQSFDDFAPSPKQSPMPGQPSGWGDGSSSAAATESANVSNIGGDTPSSAKGARGRKRNRSTTQAVESPAMTEVMTTLLSEMNSQLGKLVSKFGAETDASVKRRNIFDQLDKLPDISVDAKLDVAKFLAKNSEYMDIFYGLSEAHKIALVKKILNEIARSS